MQKNDLFSNRSPADFMETWFKNDLLSPSETKTFHAYYKNYYKNFTPFLKDNYNERLQEAIEIINSKNGDMDILDIGTGCGSEALYFATLGCNVLGIDLEESRLNVANSRKNIIEQNIQKKLSCDFKLKSVFEPDTDKKFDLIWIMETFHHIEPREDFVKKLASLLKDDGVLIISETNALNPLHQLLMIKQRGIKTIGKKIDAMGVEHYYGRERLISASKLSELLGKNKICCQKINYFRVFPVNNPASFLIKLNNNFPKSLKSFFIHYNYVGKKIIKHDRLGSNK